MKKYVITACWKQAGSHIEGSNYYETIHELLQAYEREKAKGTSVRYIGLSLSYLNSLHFESREQQAERENIMIMDTFKRAGHEVLEMSYGRLYLKLA